MDGKHVGVEAAIRIGSDFCNCKSTFRIHLLSFVDANFGAIWG
jgi:hypothetical protein